MYCLSVTSPQCIAGLFSLVRNGGDHVLSAGCIPLEPKLARSLEAGGDFMELFPESVTKDALQNICRQIQIGCGNT